MTTHQDPTDPAPFSDEELDELARLDTAGTPGPWRANGREIEQHSDAGKGYPLNYYTDCIDVATRGYDYSERPPREIGFSKDADAQLSAATRNALPRLLSGYRSLREENERLRAAIARCARDIENSAGINSAPFADMVRAVMEDSAK